MALIKCTECGHMISDKATKCPKCGCPTTKGTEPHIHQETPPGQPFYYENKKGGRFRKWLYGIIALLVALIAGGGYYFFNKANGTEREEVNEIRIDSLLADGHYTFKGNWESSRHSAQPCKLEFEKNGMNLESCAYTNLKYDTRIPLTGTIQNDTLHFVGDISGKQLVITLKIASNGDMLIGEGIDYAHSGDKAKLKLTKISSGEEKVDPKIKEQDIEGVPTQKTEKDIIKEKGWAFIYNRLKSPSTARLVGYVGPKEDVSVKFANAINLPGLSLATYQVDAQNSFGAMIRQVFVVFFKNGKPMHMEDANSLKGDVSLLRVTLEINGYDEI